MYRSTTNPNEDVKGSKYVTYLKVDRDNYKGPAGDWIRETSSGSTKADLYENQYKLKKDIKIASREELRDTFSKIQKKNENIRKIGQAYVEKFVLPDTKEFYEEARKKRSVYLWRGAKSFRR